MEIREQEDHEKEKMLMNGGTVDTKTDQTKRLSPAKRFHRKLKEDKIFRKKFYIFVALCYSFLILGMDIGQFGPTLLDLQKITGCSLDQASFFFNANTIGYLSASIVVGVMFERWNKLLQMFVPAILLSGVVAAIPWCSVYEAMVTIHVLKGFFMGIIDAVGNGLMMHLFANKVKTYIQVAHFMFAFGGIISPLVSAPFLSKPDITVHKLITMNTNTWNETEYAVVTTNQSTWNYTEYTILPTNQSLLPVNLSNEQSLARWNKTFEITEDSEVYIAYIITAILTLTSAIPFLFLYCRTDERACPSSQTQNEEHKTEKIPTRLRISALVMLCLVIASYTATEDTYAGFLTTFTFKHMNWSKANGAFATSVFWTSFAVGRFLGIFIVNLFKQIRLLFAYSLMLIFAFIFLLLSSLYFVEEGIWVSSVITGFAMSIFFPLYYSWTEENFFHVDGKVTALIMTCACMGVIINPIILARVMDTAPIWFSYMILVESGMLLVFLLTAVYIARLIKLERLKFGERTQNSREVVISLTRDSKI